MIIWFDIVNTPHVHVMRPIMEYVGRQNRLICTARDFAETRKLLEIFNISHKIIGKHHGGFMLKKLYGVAKRIKDLNSIVPYFDIAVSHGSPSTPFVCRLRNKKNISLHDNEYSFATNKPYISFVDYLIVPEYLKSTRQYSENTSFYSGYKENIYLADYQPDSAFKANLPLKDYILLRAENTKAAYVSRNVVSIVPQLLKLLNTLKQKVIFLPRFIGDMNLVRGFNNVYVPPSAMNGLDACYHAKAVLTGSGTLAREAAILGVPAVSFYPGEKLLAVDRAMIDQGRIYHSRNVRDIMKYLQTAKRRSFDRKRCIKVRDEVFNLISELLKRIEKDL